MDIFTSGDQPVPVGFTNWAGVKYRGARLPVLRVLSEVNFKPVVDRYAYAYSTYTDWRHTMENINARYVGARSSLKQDLDLLNEEDAYAAKGCVCWRMMGYGRFVYASDFRSESDEQAQNLRAAMLKRGAAYVAAVDQIDVEQLKLWFSSAPIPIDRGKGAPFFASASDRGSGFLLALLGRQLMNYEKLNNTLRDATGILNWMIMYSRVQSAKRPTPLRILSAGLIVEQGLAMQPKGRTVKAPPFFENNLNAALYDVHKQICIRIFPQHTTDISHVVDTLAKYKHVWSTDLSTCDDTMGLQTLVQYRDLILRPFWSALLRRGVISKERFEYAMAYDVHINDRRILAPARSQFEEACVLRMTGGTKSGERGTTMKNIDIVGCRNDSIVDSALSRGVKIHYMSWGDDVIWFSNDDRARDVYREIASAEQSHLWVEKDDDIPSYLMTRARTGYAYLMRQATRKVNREPREEALDVVGEALSMRASYDKLTGPNGVSHPLKDQFFDLFNDTPALKAAGDIARSNSYNELTMQFVRAIRVSSPERRFDFADDELDVDARAAVDLLQSGRTLDKRTGLMLGRNVTEAELAQYIGRWTNEEIIRMLRLNMKKNGLNKMLLHDLRPSGSTQISPDDRAPTRFKSGSAFGQAAVEETPGTADALESVDSEGMPPIPNLEIAKRPPSGAAINIPFSLTQNSVLVNGDQIDVGGIRIAAHQDSINIGQATAVEQIVPSLRKKRPLTGFLWKRLVGQNGVVVNVLVWQEKETEDDSSDST